MSWAHVSWNASCVNCFGPSADACLFSRDMNVHETAYCTWRGKCLLLACTPVPSMDGNEWHLQSSMWDRGLVVMGLWPCEVHCWELGQTVLAVCTISSESNVRKACYTESRSTWSLQYIMNIILVRQSSHTSGIFSWCERRGSVACSWTGHIATQDTQGRWRKK